MTNEELLENINQNNKTHENNKELINMYNEYIKRIQELFDFLMKKENSNLFYTIVFDILCEQGFFSATKSFKSNKKKFKELSIMPGISVVNGIGVCRNITCFYENVFKSLYKYPLKLCCTFQREKLPVVTELFGNHIISLTKYKDAIYGYDLRNHLLYKALDSECLNGLTFDYPIIYRPVGDILFETTISLNTSFDTLIKSSNFKKALLQVSSMRDRLTKEEEDKIYRDAYEFILNRIDTIFSFVIDNKELTHEIQKKMLLLK